MKIKLADLTKPTMELRKRLHLSEPKSKRLAHQIVLMQQHKKKDA